MGSRRRGRRPLLLAVFFDLLLLSSLAAWPHVRTALCPSILIALSNEKFDLMTGLAHSYSVDHRNPWAGCGAVHIEVDEREGRPSRWITLRALRVLRRPGRRWA